MLDGYDAGKGPVDVCVPRWKSICARGKNKSQHPAASNSPELTANAAPLKWATGAKIHKKKSTGMTAAEYNNKTKKKYKSKNLVPFVFVFFAFLSLFALIDCCCD